MLNKSSFRKIAGGAGCIFLGLALSGVNYCQRSYSFMEQVDVGSTATPTSEPTETPDESETAEPTETPTVTPTGEATATGTIGTQASMLDPLFSRSAALQSLDELSKLTPPSDTAPKAAAARGAGGSVKVQGNWLGQIGQGGGETAFKDSDGDGFADWLENQYGSDAASSVSLPAVSLVTNLERRLKAADSDMDGLSGSEESRLGTNASDNDTDADGVSDGAEVLSGSNPADAGVLPADSDKDGLSDVLERRIGTSPYRADTDFDGVGDGVEQAIGSDALNPDTDGDGISDGKETALGSDPAQQDFRRED